VPRDRTQISPKSAAPNGGFWHIPDGWERQINADATLVAVHVADSLPPQPVDAGSVEARLGASAPLPAAFDETGQLSDADAEQTMELIRITYSQIEQVPSLFLPFLDHLANTAPGFRYTTMASVSTSENQRCLTSPYHAFGSQVWVESLGKPGVELAAAMVWGWESIKRNWPRLVSSQRHYVVFLDESPSPAADKQIAHRQRAASSAIRQELDRLEKPYVVIRTGPMSIRTLTQYMWLQYMRLAIMARLFHRMAVIDEKQAGVELPKTVTRAYEIMILRIAGPPNGGKPAGDADAGKGKGAKDLESQTVEDHLKRIQQHAAT
jgi:hypothetical protein